MRPLYVDGMKGLGDNIYQRPFVRAAAQRHEVYLATPWPQLYADLPLRFCRTHTHLRTQARNEDRLPAATWSKPPLGCDAVTLSYGRDELARGSIVQAIEAALPLGDQPFVFNLPAPGPCALKSRKPVAVIRPATIRAEWRNEARNPDPKHLAEIAADLRRTHHVVLVADLRSDAEWLDGEPPPYDEAFVAGEFSVQQLLALIATADVVVGGVGWIVPAAIALQTRAFIVLGGQGGHNAPEKITDPRMDLSRIGWARPAAYCRCTDMLHRCDKEIPDLMDQWKAFATAQGIER
ncbi:hypothetical protein [Phenylobacterium sp.]|uniref:hypothetical protein n=1 Tax=Phenylobacterium sp. TaxID=1871053 RepID=UPI0039640214